LRSKIPSVYKTVDKDAKPGRALQFLLKYARRLPKNTDAISTSQDCDRIVFDCRMAGMTWPGLSPTNFCTTLLLEVGRGNVSILP